jgi:GNAT superfamily N-acetyltransferase
MKLPVNASLRDGTPIVIQPMQPDDKATLVAGLERMSERSRYQRFMSPKPRFTSAELTYLTDVDHHSHEALVAVEPDSGRPLGVARFVRIADEPEVAEAAAAVLDDSQRRGVGTALVETLSARAREEGITRFRATALQENKAILGLLQKVGPLTVTHSGGPEVEVEFDLGTEGRWRHLLGALRAAARGELHFALPRRAGAVRRD